MSRAPRTAHPYRDLDVIDARAPGSTRPLSAPPRCWRSSPASGHSSPSSPSSSALGLRFGRRWCLACVAYFELVQPRVGEGPIEDSRPPKFANQIGFVVLAAATVAHLAGLTLLGNALGILVATLALLAAATGICAGCEMYRVRARLRGIRRRRIDRVELTELGELAGNGLRGELLVAFSHPLCTDCRTVLGDLASGSAPWVSIDVRERPDLARKYGVALVPMVVRVAADGRVLQQVAG